MPTTADAMTSTISKLTSSPLRGWRFQLAALYGLDAQQALDGVLARATG